MAPKKSKAKSTAKTTAKTTAGEAGAKTTTATTAALSSSSLVVNEAIPALKEINRMSIISFVDIFGDDAFKAAFDPGNFNRVQALRWIRTATIAPARRIVARMADKAKSRKEPVKNSTIKDDDPVLAELGTRQVFQTFRAALAIYSYASKDQRIFQVFRNTFISRNCSIRFLNAGSFIQTVLGGSVKDSPLVIGEKPTIFEVLVWFHCINMVTTAVQEKKIALPADYRNGNIIGYIVRSICSAWDALLKNVSDQPLSAQMLPYLWYNGSTGCFELVSKPKEFAPLSQKTSFYPPIRPMKGGGSEVDETAAGRNEAEDYAMRHVVYSFLYKLKRIVLDSQIYTFKNDQEVAKYPPIKALQFASGHALPFVFVELEDQPMATLGIQKPVPPALEVINVDDDGPDTVGHVTPIPTTVHDASLVFGAGSVGTQPRQKRGMTTSAAPPAKRRKVGKGQEKPNEEEEDEIQPVPASKTTVKAEPEPLPVEEIVPALSDEFDEPTQRAYEALLQSMQDSGVCSVYNKPVDELADAHSEAQGEELEGTVQLFMTDPPYNLRRELEKDNSDYDYLDRTGMKKTVKTARFVVRPGGHIHMFCAALQFKDWHSLFAREVEEETEVDEETGEEKKMYNKVFDCEEILHEATRRPGHYLSGPFCRTLKHTSMCEYSFHLFKNGKSKEDNLAGVDYNKGGFIPSRHQGYTATIDNIPRLDPLEKVYTDQTSDSGRPLLLRPEQKSVALIQTFISKYTKPGDLVFDPFAGSYSTGRACMLLSQHRRCILGDIDPKCHKFAMRQLVEVYARQLLNVESDITGPKELEHAATVFLRQVDRINAGKMQKTWNVPAGYSPMQTFPPEVVHYICSTYRDYSLFRYSRGFSMNRWSPQWRARFNQMDLEGIQSFELSRSMLELKQSTIPEAGDGLFTTVTIPANKVIGYYYGTLVYDNMSINQKNRPRMYGDGVMAFHASEFVQWALELKTRTRSGESVWIFPAPFCVMRKINDARYRDNEHNRPTAAQLAAQPELYRQNNVMFIDKSDQPSMSDFRNYRMVEVRAKDRDIPAGAELFIDYGQNYAGFDN